jgi:hypothetical protein
MLKFVMKIENMKIYYLLGSLSLVTLTLLGFGINMLTNTYPSTWNKIYKIIKSLIDSLQVAKTKDLAERSISPKTHLR